MVRSQIIGTNCAVEMPTLKDWVMMGRTTLTMLASIGPIMLPNMIAARIE